jgi:crossover junction endodeoxyribonuclease RusA
MNDRRHWRARARLTAEVRSTSAWLAKAAHIPPSDRIAVTLTWTPAVSRRRDPDNPVPTLKAICDGLVDAGIVVDDTSTYMERTWPDIRAADPHNAGMTLVVEILEPRRAAA